MRSFTKYLGWLLLALAGALVAAWGLQLVTKIEVPNAVVPAGVLAALGAQLLSQSKNSAEAREKRSLFFLESCVKAYEEARILLEDNNNERVKWIAAGRALIHAKQLEENVTDESHLRMLELDKLKYRGFFHTAISDKPAAFFYGVEDLGLTINDAARVSSAREENAGRIIASSANELLDRSIRAVWEAAQWPADYEDPLDAPFSDAERERLMVLYPGLHQFLEHRRAWHSVAVQLHARVSRPANDA